MRVGYSTDLHGDLDVLKVHREFSKDRRLDVYVCSGDLIAPILDEEGMKILGKASQMLIQIKDGEESKKDIEELADEVSKSTKFVKEVKDIAGVYSKINKGF